MKILQIVVCLSISMAQICLGEDTIAAIRNCENRTLTDQQQHRNYGYFDQIKGITPQALDDFKSLTIKHCAILYPLVDFVYESLIKELNGLKLIVKPEDVHQYLQRWGIRQNDMAEILQRVEMISSNQMNADRKERLITFLKGTKHEATLDEIKAALTYLYGSV